MCTSLTEKPMVKATRSGIVSPETGQSPFWKETNSGACSTVKRSPCTPVRTRRGLSIAVKGHSRDTSKEKAIMSRFTIVACNRRETWERPGEHVSKTLQVGVKLLRTRPPYGTYALQAEQPVSQHVILSLMAQYNNDPEAGLHDMALGVTIRGNKIFCIRIFILTEKRKKKRVMLHFFGHCTKQTCSCVRRRWFVARTSLQHYST